MATHGLAFKDWALKEAAYWTFGIEQLRGSKLGIDAEEYLAGLLISQNREPLLPALGGLPFSLKQRVDEDVQRFHDAGIQPTFVFNGLDLACRDRSSILKASLRATETLDSAWRIYDAGKGDEAVNAFGRACTYRIYHIIRSLQAHLHSQGVRIFVAPYSAAAQLVELERVGHVHSILGSASCLVHNADGVILDFDWEDSKFLHTDLAKCAAELGVTESQFSDLCLISGYSILPTMLELDVESNMPRLETAKHLLQRHNNDTYAVCMQSKEEGYMTHFHHSRFAIKNAISINADTLEVVQINFDSALSDLHDATGRRLPNELYNYLIRGLIGPRVLNWRTRLEGLETPPLDGGLSQAYRDLVSAKLVPLRAQAQVMITHLLHRYYQKRDVDLICWFSEGSPKALNVADNLESAKKADNWHVVLENLPTATDPSGVPLRYAISALLSDADAKKTVTPRPEGAPAPLSKIPELRPNVIWRFLEHREYVKANHTLSGWGKTLHVALQKAADNGSLRTPDLAREIEEAIFMAYELIRLGCLSTSPMFHSPPYSGQPMRGSDTDKQNVILISRVACLAKFQHRAIGYTGPLSRHLLAYHQVAAAVRGALRDLVETHACNMFLAGSVVRMIDEPTMFTDLSFGLPFVDEPDAGLALLVKSYLDELSNDSGRKRANIADWFTHAEDIEGDLAKVWKLFEAVNAGVQSADSAIIDTETKRMFRDAEQWLTQKRQAEATSEAASQ